MYHSPPVSSVVLLLPLRQPPDQLQDGALRKRRVPVGRPANELEVLHQTVTVLWLRRQRLKLGGAGGDFKMLRNAGASPGGLTRRLFQRQPASELQLVFEQMSPQKQQDWIQLTAHNV